MSPEKPDYDWLDTPPNSRHSELDVPWRRKKWMLPALCVVLLAALGALAYLAQGVKWPTPPQGAAKPRRPAPASGTTTTVTKAEPEATTDSLTQPDAISSREALAELGTSAAGILKLVSPASRPTPTPRPASPDDSTAISDLVEEVKKARGTPTPTPRAAAGPTAAPVARKGGIEIDVQDAPFSVTSIETDEKISSATINGRAVREGVDYGLFKVLRIEKDKVTIQQPGRNPVVLTR